MAEPRPVTLGPGWLITPDTEDGLDLRVAPGGRGWVVACVGRRNMASRTELSRAPNRNWSLAICPPIPRRGARDRPSPGSVRQAVLSALRRTRRPPAFSAGARTVGAQRTGHPDWSPERQASPR